jgi:hypothetical protein
MARAGLTIKRRGALAQYENLLQNHCSVSWRVNNSIVRCLRRVTAISSLLAVLGTATAARAPITNASFVASLTSGSLSGVQFTVSYSYDNAGITAGSEDYLPLQSFDFDLLGAHFSKNDIYQGGQVIFHHGILYNVTADFDPAVSGAPTNAPLNSIAFGFGGPGIIGYTDKQGEYGSGVFSLISSNIIPKVVSVSIVGNGLQLVFTTTNHLNYVVEYTADLVPTNWISLTNLTATGTTTTVADPGAASQPQRFYRVGLVP